MYGTATLSAGVKQLSAVMSVTSMVLRLSKCLAERSAEQGIVGDGF